jgi:hypothetical protein
VDGLIAVSVLRYLLQSNHALGDKTMSPRKPHKQNDFTYDKYTHEKQVLGLAHDAFYNLSSVHNQEDFDRERLKIHEHQIANVFVFSKAADAVDFVFKAPFRKNGTLIVSNAHSWLFWYQVAIVNLEYFKNKWSNYAHGKCIDKSIV